MALAWDETLDTPRAFDGVASFIGGQLSYAKARLLKPDQASLLQDCEVEITGEISTRFGTTQLGGTVGSGTKIDALAFMNAPNYSYEIAVSGNTIYRLNGATWQSIGALTVADLPSITQGNHKVYFASGGDIYQWDGVSLTNLSGDLATNAPRNVSMLRWHTNRLFAAGPSIKAYSTDANPIPDALFASYFLDASTWGDAVKQVPDKISGMLEIGGGDGQPITALTAWTNFNLVVFKRRSVYVVQADPTIGLSDMVVQQVHPTVGCVARRSAIQVGADILFLADDGIRSLQQVVGSDQQHELSVPLSFPVQDVINRVNWTAAASATATFWRNRYIIALPLDGSTTNNYLLVFNTVTKSWQGTWTNLPINTFAVRESGNIPRLMMGLSTDKLVIEYLDYVNPSNWITSTFQDYNSTQVQPRVKTRAFLMEDVLGMKLAFGGEIEWNNSSGQLVVTPILDEVSKDSFTIDIPSGGFSIPFTPPFTLAPKGLARKQFDLMKYGEWRELQFDILGSGTGRKEIRQIAISGIVRPTLVGNS